MEASETVSSTPEAGEQVSPDAGSSAEQQPGADAQPESQGEQQGADDRETQPSGEPSHIGTGDHPGTGELAQERAEVVEKGHGGTRPDPEPPSRPPVEYEGSLGYLGTRPDAEPPRAPIEHDGPRRHGFGEPIGEPPHPDAPVAGKPA